MGSPRLQAWDITRLACNWLKSSFEMLILQSEPKPVVMPYSGFSEVSILWSRYALQSLILFLLSSDRASVQLVCNILSMTSKVSGAGEM